MRPVGPIEQVPARSGTEFEAAFASLVNNHIDGLLVTPDPLFMSHRADLDCAGGALLPPDGLLGSSISHDWRADQLRVKSDGHV